jgi:hypothetical protein
VTAELLKSEAVLVSRAEELLAGHRDFSCADLIWQRASARLTFALEILGERLPGVGGAVRELAGNGCLPQALRDPVVRMTTEAALQRLKLGQLGSPDDLELVLGRAAAGAVAGDDRGPAQLEEGCGLRAGPQRRIWVLGFPPACGPLAGQLAQACRENFIDRPGRTGQLNPGTARTAALVDRATRVLTSTLPVLGPEVISHVTALGLMTADGDDGAMLSAAGGAPVPGVVIIRPGELNQPWDAAGRILHEALHLKLFDISVCSALIADLDGGTQVPWRPSRWDIRRVLAAFHVYVHVVLFHAAVRARGQQLAAEFGDPPANPGVSASSNLSYARPEERLGFLAEQLTGPLAKDLTSAGRQFVGWQLDAIAPLLATPVTIATTLRPAAPSVHPSAGYEQVPGCAARRDPATGAGYVFNPESGLLHVLNLAAWVAFRLCDGRDLAAVRTSYEDLTASRLTGAGAASHLNAALAQLKEAGLIKPIAPAHQERR